MSLYRRHFLQRTAAAGAALGFADWSGLLPISPSRAQVALPPNLVQFSPDLEPIVRLIEETPRAKCPAMMVEQLKNGLPYRNFVAALFLANIRTFDYGHTMAGLWSAHQLAVDMPVQERLLPIFYAMDVYKAPLAMHNRVVPGAKMRPLAGNLPAADKAEDELHAAMKAFDPDQAERAIAVMVRNQGAHRVIEPLWHYGARDWSFIGHIAIWVASAWRCLQTIGWQHAEPTLRSMVREMIRTNGSKNLGTQPYAANLARVAKNLAQLPADWAQSDGDRVFTTELLGLIGGGQEKIEAACALAAAQLAAGKVKAGAVWDAVHLGAAQLGLAKASNGDPCHPNTSANALHYAFQSSADPANRFLILLQAVGWVCLYGSTPSAILQLAPAKIANTPEEAIAGILAVRTTQPLEAARQAFAFEQRYPGSTRLQHEARRLMPMKATWDPHDIKFPAAMFENCDMVNSMWRPHLLAATTVSFFGSDIADNTVTHQAREALRKL